MNNVLFKDLNNVVSSNIIDWRNIENSSILITGSTGLIGSLLVKAIILKKCNVKLVLPVRSIDKAIDLFGDTNNIEYIKCDIEHFFYDKPVDYIIHAASPTKSNFFVNYPVETIDTAIFGTKKILDYCCRFNIKSVVYLSSMEMYGVLESKNVTEDDLGYLNNMDIRSSYSESKRLCELYCKSYFEEYGVPVKIARLAMTFGPGIPKSENRVYKYFCDCVLNNEDIILRSTGETVINFCYTVDAVIGILCILLNGRNGEAYNIVSDNEDETIKSIAEWMIQKYGNGKNRVICQPSNETTAFAPNNHMILCNNKLKSIGWKSCITLKEAFNNLLIYIKEELYE